MRFLLSFSLCALAACGQGGSTPGASPAGAAPPPIEVVDLAGLEGVLAAHRGRAVVLNLWAMW